MKQCECKNVKCNDSVVSAHVTMGKKFESELAIVTNLKPYEDYTDGRRSTTMYELWQNWYQRHISKSNGVLNRDKYAADRLIDLMMDRECNGFAKAEAFIAEGKLINIFYK